MPLFWSSLAFLLGIASGPFLDLPTIAWLALAGLFLTTPFLPRILRGRFSFPPTRATGSTRPTGSNGQSIHHLFAGLTRLPYALVPVFFALGAARLSGSTPVIDQGQVAYYNDMGKIITLRAALVEPADVRDGFSFLKVRAKSLQFSSTSQAVPVGGLVQVRSNEMAEWRYGDELLLQGWMVTPPEEEEFSYRAYLARQGVYSNMNLESARLVNSGQGSAFKAAIYGFKARALEAVYRLWPDPEASLLAGILLGVESGIPDQVKKAFQDTGTAHVIAISG